MQGEEEPRDKGKRGTEVDLKGQESEDLKNNGGNGGGHVHTVSAMGLPLPSTPATWYLVLIQTLPNTVHFTDGQTQVQRIKMSSM